MNYFSDPLAWDRALGKHAHLLADMWADYNEHVPEDMMRASRWPRLKRLIAHAYEHVPLYKGCYQKSGIKPADIKSENDLALLPIVSKKDFKHHQISGGDAADNIAPARGSIGFSSGSTGEPFRYISDRAFSNEKNYLRYRFWRWVGADAHALKLWCSSERGRGDMPRTLYLPPHRIRQHKKEYIDLIRSSGVRILAGSPLDVFDLLWMLAQENIDDIFFDKAVLLGHVMAPGIRSFLRERFHCEAFEYYGASEIGFIAGECSLHRGFHVQEENMIVEIVDEHNKKVAPGTVGRIILTLLSNEIMPFIRYDIGDAGVLLPLACPCGMTSKLLMVEGRSNEYLFVGPQGESIFPTILRHDVLDPYFMYFHRYQMVQKGLDEFELKVIPTAAYDPALSEEIISKIQQSIGYPVTIVFRCVEYIEPLPSGKFQYFVSEIGRKKMTDIVGDTHSLEQRLASVMASHADAGSIGNKSHGHH